MNLQPDEFTGPAAGSESCRAAVVGSAPEGTAIRVPAALPAQQRGRALISADGVLRGCQQKGWRGRWPLEIPKDGGWLLFSAWDVCPTAGQAGSRSAPQTPGRSAVTFPSSTAAAPPTQPYPPPQVPDVLRPHALPSSPGHPKPPAQPLASSAPAGCPWTPGFQPRYLFSVCPDYSF